MQRVTSMLPSWDKTKSSSKKGFDKAYAVVDKLGPPINRFSNKIGSEAFWPTTLDKESDKSARILKSFCKDGFYAEEDRPATIDVPKGKQRVLKKIPEKVIQNAVGLAIFTTMRTGLWVSGAGGSGVLIARMENGEWSPPSGIMLHTAGLGFLVGVDIYDCVVVINNRKALESFTKIRATLGGEISAVAGPVGVGGVLENDGKWKQANRPVFTYLKSRGLYAGVQVDGTVIIERTDENERFYGERIGVADILAGKVRHAPYETRLLMETVKAAEGRSDIDRSLIREIEDQPAPGDVEVSSPTAGATFGIPEPDDPDPFGVLALEKIGLEIKEAGSNSRPSSTQFEFNPSPTSPVYGKYHRRSMDTLGTRSNRESYMSTRSSRTRTSTDRTYQTTEMSTQTDDLPSPNTSPNRSTERIVEEEEKLPVASPEEVDYTKIDLGPYSNLAPRKSSEDLDGTTMNDSPRVRDVQNGSVDTSYVTDDDEEDEPVIFEAASAQAHVLTPQAIKAHGGVVNIPKRPPPPPLPPRSVARTSKLMVDQGSGRSPMKEGFEEVDLHGVDRQSVEIENRKSIDLQSRKSTELQPVKSAESEKVIIMEDLEKQDSNTTADTVNNKDTSFEEKVENALKEQNLNDITPVTTLATPLAAEASENLLNIEVDGKELGVNAWKDRDDDEFHSVPTTPGEVLVK